MRFGLSRWWNGPDHYDWISNYLGEHGLRPFIRNVMLGVLLALSSVVVAMHWSPAGPRGFTRTAVAGAVVVCCIAMAYFWLRRWPTRRESATFSVIASFCMASACLVQHDPLAALTGSLSFVMLGGYVGICHNAKVLTANLAISCLTIVELGVRVAQFRHDAALALSKTVMIVLVLVAVPVVLHVIVVRLAHDIVRSEFDPLSGLLNRRGLRQQLTQLGRAGSTSAQDQVTVMVIDLDGFKKINDTRGHAAGDETLVAVGATIRSHTPTEALTARIGGEEFLIAHFTGVADPTLPAENLRLAISRLPQQITCSIGVAVATVKGLSPDIEIQVRELIAVADAAMYSAKQAGGNRVALSASPGCARNALRPGSRQGPEMSRASDPDGAIGRS